MYSSYAPSDGPTYHVPSADGVRIAAPGRWWRCLLIMILGAGPVGVTIIFIGALIESANVGSLVRGLLLNEGGDPSGALILPCIALIPVIAIALTHNIVALRTPTLKTVTQANHWIRRLGWACGWAVLAGIIIAGWLFFWGMLHFKAF